MADGQIGEDEVASRIRAIKIGHASNRHTREHWHGLSDGLKARLGHRSGGLQSGEEEEAGIVRRCDVLFLISFVDSQSHNRRWVYRTTIG